MELKENITFYADSNILSTVIRNLISNAVKFTSTGGIIKLEYTIDTETNTLLFSIIDNGVGIRDEQKDKLFNIDENVSTKGTNRESGTGLGLILCKELILKHSGKIWFSSQFGKGSNFYVSIPLQITQ